MTTTVHHRSLGFRYLLILVALLIGLAWSHSSVVAANDAPGAVYSLTNDAAGNAVLVFSRAAGGSRERSGRSPALAWASAIRAAIAS